jgi:hypothetical protein
LIGHESAYVTRLQFARHRLKVSRTLHGIAGFNVKYTLFKNMTKPFGARRK